MSKQAVKLPEMGESIQEVEIGEIHVAEGDLVEIDQDLLTLDSDKASTELPSPKSGKVVSINVKKGDSAKIGEVLLEIETDSVEGEDDEPHQEKNDDSVKTAPSKIDGNKTGEVDKKNAGQTDEPSDDEVEQTEESKDSQDHQKQAEESNQDNGNKKADIKKDQAKSNENKSHSSKDAGNRRQKNVEHESNAIKLPDFEKYGEVEVIDLSKIQQATAKKMTQSWKQIPHVTHHDECDIGKLEEVRKKMNANIDGEKKPPISLTAILVRTLSALLSEHQNFNGSFDPENNQLIVKSYINIGVATNTTKGLVVPTIKKANSKSIIEINAELDKFKHNAHSGRFESSDLQGGTFTLTNIGSIGGSYFTPIIHWPEVAILGVGTAYREGGFRDAVILPISMSYDHRVINGAEAAEFVNHLKQYLQSPVQLLLNL